MRIQFISLAVLLLAACAEIKPYPDLANKNLHIQIQSASGSMLTDVKASVEIYAVKADCSTEYQGAAQLDLPENDLGLPPKQQSYLVFVLSSGFRSAPSTTTYKTLLNVRTGYRYNAKISYINGVYNIVMLEMNPAGKQSKELVFEELDVCSKV